MVPWDETSLHGIYTASGPLALGVQILYRPIPHDITYTYIPDLRVDDHQWDAGKEDRIQE